MPVRAEAVVGQQPQASRREKDKLEGTGLRKQCYVLRYFLSESRIRGCACQWLSEWGSRLDRVFFRNCISGCEWMKERHFLHRSNSRPSDAFGKSTGYPEALDIISLPFEVVLYLSVYVQKFPCCWISFLNGKLIKSEELCAIEQEARRMWNT